MYIKIAELCNVSQSLGKRAEYVYIVWQQYALLASPQPILFSTTSEEDRPVTRGVQWLQSNPLNEAQPLDDVIT